MASFKKWLVILESNLDQFSKGVLVNARECTPWFVAADFADENNLKHLNFSVGNLLRAMGILCRDGMDASEEIARLSGTSDDPPGRVALINACRSSVPWFDKWRKKRPDLLPFMTHGIVPDELEGVLPAGGGIDGDWVIEFDQNRQVIECDNSYHAMDEYGGYVGWADFEVVIPVNRPLDFEINFLNPDHDIALDIDLNGISEAVSQWIFYPLREYLTGNKP